MVEDGRAAGRLCVRACASARVRSRVHERTCVIRFVHIERACVHASVRETGGTGWPGIDDEVH